MPSLYANATSTAALWPGSVASVGDYCQELTAQRRAIPPFSALSILGLDRRGDSIQDAASHL